MTKAQARMIKEIPKLLKAIKMRCLDCSAYSIFELKNCVCLNCPLYLWRTGELPQKTKLRADRQKIPYKKSPVAEKNDILEIGSGVKNGN
jgi:hypothetical protein